MYRAQRFKAQLRLIAFVSLVTILSACATIKTGSHYDETADFSSYETFGWLNGKPYVYGDSGTSVSALTQAKIQSAIEQQLVAAGFRFTDSHDEADMLVAFTIGTREKITQEAYGIEYPGNWGWHVSGSYYHVREIRQHSYTQGTLGVDIFDGKTNKPIWHGWAQKTITSDDRKDPSATIKAGVAKLFEAFPR